MRAETKITDKRTKKMAKNFHEQRPAKNKLILKHFANSFYKKNLLNLPVSELFIDLETNFYYLLIFSQIVQTRYLTFINLGGILSKKKVKVGIFKTIK